MAFAPLPGGEMLYLSYNSQAAILGNNYVDSIGGWAGLNLSSVYPISFQQGNELWMMGINGMAIIQNKKVKKIVRKDWANCWFTKSQTGKGVLITDYVNHTIHFFDGVTATLKLTMPIPAMEEKVNHPFLLYNKCVPDNKHRIWNLESHADTVWVSKYNETANHFDTLAAYTVGAGFGTVLAVYIEDEKNFIIQNANHKKTLLCRKGFIEHTDVVYNAIGNLENNQLAYTNHLTGYYKVVQFVKDNYSELFSPTSHFNDTEKPLLTVEKKVSPYISVNKASGSYLLGTENKPIRAFPLLQKYPRVYTGTHSNATFALSQDEKGNIWAGSYLGNVTLINKDKETVTRLRDIRFQVMNGSLQLNGKTYFIGEGIGGLQAATPQGFKKIQGDIATGFYLYQSPISQKIYYGKSNYLGLWQTDAASLDKGIPQWNKIDSTNGMKLHNVLTITEDKKGRIWCGHAIRGIAVYNPNTNKAQTWITDKNETPFGAMSSLTDKWGTVWLGSKGKGLWYYNRYDKEPSPSACMQINHPLLKDPAKTIMSMTASYGRENYLVLGCYDKICLLNLDSFYAKGKILVRYLNPEAASFSSFTEQNTMLTSHTDSSIWFSTSDAVYNWDIKKWLALPVYKVATDLRLSFNNDSIFSLEQNKHIYLSPTGNNLSIEVRFLSEDLLPRYLNLALVKEGDSLVFENPGLENSFQFKNLESGAYNLCLRIFEADGTTRLLQYKLIIRKFLWQQWWFWAIISIAVIGILAYLLSMRNRRQIAEQKARLKEAELHSFKAEQEKKLADLRLISLSSQFRPHFILNALNTIGAQMEDKPETETVLSRLGESVNLIFNHATQQKTMHPFKNEWHLVTNIIDIHRLMYLKQLTTTLPPDEVVNRVASLQVPMGLLQIPVENALLHGLNNRDAGPWQLGIGIIKHETGIEVIISDNGVGRKKSANLSNHTKHGTGTKNLNETIAIINGVNEEKITFTYTDEIWDDSFEKYGTAVNIFIPYNIKYYG
jgi:hypothetical protein